jgi:exoribonuclease R
LSKIHFEPKNFGTILKKKENEPTFRNYLDSMFMQHGLTLESADELMNEREISRIQNNIKTVLKEVRRGSRFDRTSFDKEMVFSVGSLYQPIQNAFHFTEKEGGTFEIGVHISDVSAFVLKSSDCGVDSKNADHCAKIIAESIGLPG